MPRRAFRLLSAALLGASLLAPPFLAGCAWLQGEPTASEKKPSADEGPWYNSSFFRPVWGDYERLEGVAVLNPEEREKLIQRGALLTRSVAACGVCHGAKQNDPFSPLSGGAEIEDSFGKVRAANITSDPDTGIGKWNVFELMRAIRSSIDREGRPLSLDVHKGYRWMSDPDARAIAEYLLASNPARNEVERRLLGPFERNRFGVIPRHQPVAGYIPNLPEVPDKHYGRYLTYSVAQCAMCHTDRGGVLGSSTPLGGPATNGPVRRLLKGLFSPGELLRSDAREVESVLSEQSRAQYRKANPEVSRQPSAEVDSSPSSAGDGGFPVLGPDIRGLSSGGLQQWSQEDIVRYLSSGVGVDGRKRDGALCPWPAYKEMPAEYKRAIAEYLKSVG